MRGGSLNDPLSKYMFVYPTSNTYTSIYYYVVVGENGARSTVIKNVHVFALPRNVSVVRASVSARLLGESRRV